MFILHLGYAEAHSAFFSASFQSGQGRDLQNAGALLGLAVNSYEMPSSGDGGVEISPDNLVLVQSVLDVLRRSYVRVLCAFVIAAEAYLFFEAAFIKGMIGPSATGFVWFGADGINGAQFGGDRDNVAFFDGVVYIESFSRGPLFSAMQDEWAQEMPTTDVPEFFAMPLCNNGICSGDSDFIGWDSTHPDTCMRTATHLCKCQGYTALAYDAMITLALAADRLMSRLGTDVESFTATNWHEELGNNTDSSGNPANFFDCMSGPVSFNSNQERDMPNELSNWQLDSVSAVTIAKWTALSGFVWETGAVVRFGCHQSCGAPGVSSAGRGAGARGEAEGVFSGFFKSHVFSDFCTFLQLGSGNMSPPQWIRMGSNWDSI
jgi:hypothetical protein